MSTNLSNIRKLLEMRRFEPGAAKCEASVLAIVRCCPRLLIRLKTYQQASIKSKQNWKTVSSAWDDKAQIFTSNNPISNTSIRLQLVHIGRTSCHCLANEANTHFLSCCSFLALKLIQSSTHLALSCQRHS